MAPSRLRLGGAALLVLAALVAGAPPAPASAPRRGRLDRALGAAVSPGALAEAHAHLEGVSACAQCHAPLGGTPDARCLACHEAVGARMREAVGVHAGFTGACASCHADHRGPAADLLGLERETFSHERARFALRGAHREVDCDDCHVGVHPETGREAFRAQGVAFARCADCHTDPHGAGFAGGRDCSACHGEAGFGWGDAADAAEFDHARDADFPLVGRHAGAACAGCHTPERRVAAEARGEPPGRGVPADCGGCHEDAHRGALAGDCGSCHAPESPVWEAPRFDHARTRLPLDALHARLACDACHEDAAFRARSSDCAGCHPDAAALLAGAFGGRRAPADPHESVVDCRGCHPAAQARPRLLDHERACVSCHPATYGGLLLTRRRLLDELVVRAETALRRAELASRRGEVEAGEEQTAAALVERLARSGAHHAGLAEAVLREVLSRHAERSGSR